MKYDNITQTIGNTPVVRLNHLPDLEAAELWVKLESFNPAGSVKDRPALNMIIKAEQRGELKAGDTIIEPTSGNTGIGLAMIAAERGYPAVFVMAEDMSEERKKILLAYGGKLVLTPAKLGTKGAIEEAKRLAKEKGWFFIGQHFNADNPGSHQSTANEIWQDFGADLDAVISTTGTGGTISGIGKYLRQHHPEMEVVATEPADSPVLSQGIFCKHKIMGTAPGFIPDILDTEIYDKILSISTEEAFAATRHLAQREGIFAGISSGAAVAGMIQLAKDKAYRGKILLAIAPDTGERYLSTDVWD